MSSPSTFASVLSAIGIKRGAFIDDQYRPQYNDAIALSVALTSPDNKTALSKVWGGGVWAADSTDQDRAATSDLWSNLPFGPRKLLLAQLHEMAHKPVQAVAPFSDVWPTTLPLDLIAPEDCTDGFVKETLIAKGPSLVFIDLSLEGDDESGIGVLQALKKLGAGATICAILTNAVPDDPAAERAKWDELALRYSLPKSSGLVISKKRIEEEDVFSEALRRAIVNSIAPDMMKWGQAVASRAVELAFKDLDVEGDVLDTVVIRSSEREGIHPTQTLFRLMDGEFRHKREHDALSEPAVKEFQTIQTKLAALAGLRKKGGDEEKEVKQVVKRWRNDELYRTRLDVAGSPPATWLGDIWEVTTHRKDKDNLDIEVTERMVVIAQPCDIILRTDGSRSQEWVMLAPISDATPKSEHRDLFVEMPYYKAGTYQSQWLSLKRARPARSRLLDLAAVVGPDLSKERVQALATWPHVHASVVARMKELCTWLQPVVANGMDDRMALFLDHGPVAKVEGPDPIRLFLRRVGRVEPEFAQMILQRFGTFVSRPALSHDFAATG